MFLNILQYSQDDPVLESLFNKECLIKVFIKILLKETPTQVFSCEYCKIVSFFIEHLWWLILYLL